jgi:protein ImuA
MGDAVLPTGHPALNTHLPGGGWPVDGLVELLQAQPGLHVWQLLLPALAQAVQAQPGPVVLVGAPFEPFGPTLAAQGLPGERLLCVRGDKPAARLWAAEQALRCADVVAVLAWLPQARADQLRRLHLAAQQHQGQRRRLLFVFRTPAAQHESSPARLRLLLQGTDALQVRILKRRGPPVDTPVLLPAHPPRLAALLASRRQQPIPPTALQPRSPIPIQAHALDRPVTA